jgi:phage shock protein C
MNSTTHSKQPRRLTRSVTDKTVAGVSGGLGEYFSVDPVLFRVGFAAGAVLTGGILALAYLALVIVVPSDGDIAPSTASGGPVAA